MSQGLTDDPCQNKRRDDPRARSIEGVSRLKIGFETFPFQGDTDAGKS